MPDDALIDGRAADASWLDERALQFGDGLFETIAIIDARPCLWELHMARLEEGCRRLQLPCPDVGLLAEEAGALCAARPRAVLKLYWTAGRSARGYRRPAPLRPRRMLRVSDWSAPPEGEPWALRLCQHRLGDHPALAGIKHLNRLDQVIARAEWDGPANSEGLMLDQQGHVVSGTMSNLFLQQGERLSTPPIDRAGIAGVVRQLALTLARQGGAVIDESPVAPEQVRQADALYLTNSLIGVVRVARFEDREYDLAAAEHPVMHATRQRCHRPAGGNPGGE